MIQKSMSLKDGAETAVRDIRRKTRKQYSAEEKIRIVLSGLRGEDSIAIGLPPSKDPNAVKLSSYTWISLERAGQMHPNLNFQQL